MPGIDEAMITQMQAVKQRAAELRRELTITAAPLRKSTLEADQSVLNQIDVISYYLREAEVRAARFLSLWTPTEPDSAPPPVVEQPGSPL